ncbi:tRNA pseudouridine(55) synthase TruB [Marinicrinis lubricantis]|uniref:tRNA pseudouridine synthase B n=1 Tax=Marinicrinis lubricantis TaxID=2086470 RepID=A0ABW1IMV9_9BACL
MLEGVLPIYKPAGMTSHDVVAKVRRILKIRRIGHTGTLDPAVTGVLPLCIGRATRLVEYIQERPKQYEAEMLFGYATDTEDTTGETIEKAKEVHISEEDVHRALQAFVGTIEQVPPMFSAVKVGGKRLYELARQGQTVERKPRTVQVYAIELLFFQAVEPYPILRFRADCSKGTYIRTLCVDIGKALGVPAVMSKLVRTQTGSFALSDCVTLEQLQAAADEGRVQQLLTAADRAVAHLPELHLFQKEAIKVMNGQVLELAEQPFPSGLVRVYGDDLGFIGIYEWNEQSGKLVPAKVFRTLNE